MADKRDREQAQAKDRDERTTIPLDPEEALRGLLSVELPPEKAKAPHERIRKRHRDEAALFKRPAE